jgi:hypothetical protein
MKKYFVTIGTLAFALILTACSNESDLSNSTAPAVVETPASNDALTPEETLSRLKELAAAGDWETYVDDFYGESHKFEGKQERRDAVVARFRDKWASEVVEGFDALDEGNATIIEDGKKAVFTLDGEPSFFLFLDDNNRWTFHL